ncbi:MAG: hypothetical protein IJ960_02200 [Oscillospiraceae bacterium]|nr:hypothetical protein [Oscillospiraceae bacterium]
MKYIDQLHNFSLRILTLCGICAVASLAVNVLTALVMFAAECAGGKKQ